MDFTYEISFFNSKNLKEFTEAYLNKLPNDVTYLV